MIAFQDRSIRQKLMAMSLFASCGALLLASVLFMTIDFIPSRESLVRQFASLADIISFNTSSAVLFNDSAAAEKTLTSLQRRPSLLSATIYTPSGQVFANWHRAETTPLPAMTAETTGTETHRFEHNTFILSHPIIFDKTLIGTLTLQSDLKELTQRLRLYIMITGVVLILSFGVAALISFKTGQKLSEPILHLTQTAQWISEKNDYSVRAKIEGHDELALLTQTFNAMLTKIQQDEHALRAARDELEQRVEERTVQLT